MVGWMPGIWELLVLVCILGLGLVPVAIALVILGVVSRRNKAQRSNPNLTPCPDCRNLVSIHAPACPKCGRPMGPSKTP